MALWSSPVAPCSTKSPGLQNKAFRGVSYVGLYTLLLWLSCICLQFSQLQRQTCLLWLYQSWFGPCAVEGSKDATSFRCSMSSVRLAVCTQSVCHRCIYTKQQNALLVWLLRGYGGQGWQSDQISIPSLSVRNAGAPKGKPLSLDTLLKSSAAWNCWCAGVIVVFFPSCQGRNHFGMVTAFAGATYEVC